MFDSKEIANKALLRASDLKTTMKRRRRRWEIIGVLLAVCAVAGIVMIVQGMKTSQPSFQMIDNETPLSAFPVSDEDGESGINADPEEPAVFDEQYFDDEKK